MAKESTSESKKLHNQLNEIALKIQRMQDIIEEHNTEHDNEYLDLKIQFYQCILDLYKQSIYDNYFWQFCPFIVYESHLNNRFIEHRKEFPDISRVDFLMDEIEDIERNILKKGSIGLISSPDPVLAEELRLKEDKINYWCGYGNILFGRDLFNLSIFKKFSQTQKRKINYLRNECNSNLQVVETELIQNDFSEIFTEGGFNKFCLLNDKYTKDNKSLKAKYSNLFHYFSYKALLNCTQKEYIDFINKNYGVKMSKILPKTNKYSDTIQPLLIRYFKEIV
jgi:hypothetical protein